MIVRKNTKGWQVYFHRAHALLAMKIAIALGRELWPLKQYWSEGLSSITDHDSGRQEWKSKNHLNESGAPLDYRDRKECDFEQVRRVISNAKYKSSFIALMISKHCHELYKDNNDKEVKEFLKEQKELRKEIRDHLGLSSDITAQCYEFVRWCDELSLILCQDDILTNSRKVEVGTLGKYGMITIHRDSSEKLILEPWCFNSVEVELQVEYFITSRMKFKSDAELKDEFNLTRPLVETFRFCK